MEKLISVLILLLTFNLSFAQVKEALEELIMADFKLKMEKDNVSDFFLYKQITQGIAHLTDPKKPDSCNAGGYFTMYGFGKREMIPG